MSDGAVKVSQSTIGFEVVHYMAPQNKCLAQQETLCNHKDGL
jgi:hypothetical protein